MQESLNPKIVAYLVAALVCSWVVIAIALAALLTAWRKITNQEGDIQRLTEERGKQSNALREKECDIIRLEKTVDNLIKGRTL